MTAFQFRRHQPEAVDAAEQAFRSGANRVLWDMCVGAGKSITYAEMARREIARGGRAIIVAPSRELVEQNAAACRQLGLQVGINAAAIDERTWRAPVISASINSVYAHAASFGPISLLMEDEAHLVPHSEAGMLRAFRRGLGNPRTVGGTGTPFRLMGGSLIEGEGAPYERIVYRYSIIDGIRDGYLVAPFSASVDDKMDVSKLRIAQGEYTEKSQDAQMIAMADNHIAQMLHYGAKRRSWLVFEASRKAAIAMHARMNEWGIPTGLVLGDKTKADALNRRNTVEALRAGRIRAVVNVECLTTGFDVQEIDMLVCRRRTKSLSLWIQIVGRLLRTVGGNIEASILAGKADGLLLDFAGNVDEFGPLDFIRPKDTVARLVSCESCGKRNGAAARNCWSCDDPMTKLCPACLEHVVKGTLDCPHCEHDFRLVAEGETLERKPAALLETPSGAALIAAFKPRSALDGGWVPIRKAFSDGQVLTETGELHALPELLQQHAADTRWIRCEADAVVAILVPNGAARSSVKQYGLDGRMMVVPMPQVRQEAAA